MEISYCRGSISPEEVVKFLSLTGQAQGILREVVVRREVVRKAQELGLGASDEQLQAFCDEFRVRRGLHAAEDTRRFLSAWGLTEDDLEAYCESCVLVAAVRDALADENRITEHFVNNRSEYDRARISVLCVEAQELAREIVMRVAEDAEDFHQLAREHSTDETTRHAGGYVGVVGRSTLSPQVAAKVFAAKSGDVLGPFPHDKAFQVVLVEQVMQAELNDATKKAIKERIFREWASRFLKEGITIRA